MFFGIQRKQNYRSMRGNSRKAGNNTTSSGAYLSVIVRIRLVQQDEICALKRRFAYWKLTNAGY
jgi:hypothetical protein